MQKKLIALAVAGLVSGGAFAQSSVTLYGIIDQAIETGSFGTGRGTITRLAGSGYATERLGFRGEEDMGGGTYAGFVQELGQRSNNGTLDNNVGMLFQRYSALYMRGSFGDLRGGRVYSPIFQNVQIPNDLFGLAGVGSNYSLTNTGMTRVSNSVSYTSPIMGGGFKVVLLYGLGDNTTATATSVATAAAPAGATLGTASNPVPNPADPKDVGRHTGMSLTYANGPIYVGWGYGAQKSTTAFPATIAVVETKANMLSASYNFGAVKVAGGWQTWDNSTNTVDLRSWNLGATMPIGSDWIRAQYTVKENKKLANADSNLWALGYVHPMSKRTTLYATWARMSNDTLAASGMIFSSVAAEAAGQNGSALQVGLSHNF